MLDPLSSQNETPPICYTICQQPLAQPTMGGALEVHNEPTKSYRLVTQLISRDFLALFKTREIHGREIHEWIYW